MSIALSTFARDWGGNSSKKDRKDGRERSFDALMVRIIAKQKNSKKVFLIVYFHLRFSIA